MQTNFFMELYHVISLSLQMVFKKVEAGHSVVQSWQHLRCPQLCSQANGLASHLGWN